MNIQVNVSKDDEELLFHTCENCGHVFEITVLKWPDPSEWNDLGQRWCPLCGMLVSE